MSVFGHCDAPKQSCIHTMMHAGGAFGCYTIYITVETLPAVLGHAWPASPVTYFCMIHAAVSVCCAAASLHKTACAAAGKVLVS